MNSKYVLPESVVLNLDGGEIAFGWVARAWDEFYHRLVVVELRGQTTLYGEWAAKYAANNSDFDIEILGFGYRDGFTVGSPNAQDRVALSPAERALVEHLIRSLFSDAAATSTENPFALKGARYTGIVRFAPGSIREH